MSKPTHNVYTNVNQDSKIKLKIGAAWLHENGGGFNIILNALPVDGRLVAFEMKDDENAEAKDDNNTEK